MAQIIPEEYVGKTFNHLTIISLPKKKGRKWRVQVKCECGNVKECELFDVRSGHTKSCGCYNISQIIKRNTSHNLTKHPLYQVWNAMLKRCYNSGTKQYKDYGGRGIIVCDEWKKDFVPFYNHCINNGWKIGLQIDRINNDGNYEPDNIKISTRTEQARNTRKSIFICYKGQVKTLAEWCETFKLNYGAVAYRIRNNWAIDRAFNYLKPL